MNGVALSILGDFQRILALRYTNQPMGGSLGSPFCQFFAIGQQYKVSSYNGRICAATPNREVNGNIFTSYRELTSQPSGNHCGDFLRRITVRQLNGNSHELRNRHILNERRPVLASFAHIKGIGFGIWVGALFISGFLVFELRQSFADVGTAALRFLFRFRPRGLSRLKKPNGHAGNRLAVIVRHSQGQIPLIGNKIES